jgi:hypothetical protein
MLATQSSKPQGELRGQSGSRVRFAENVLTSPSNAAPYGSNPRIQQSASHTKGLSYFGYEKEQVGHSRGQAPPRSVLEYQPPSAFLDAVERPVAEPRKSALDDFLLF